MKLKKAIKVARIKGFNYVAVDDDGCVFAYADKPFRCPYQWTVINGSHSEYIGDYTGKKGWGKTLREAQ